MKPLVARPPLHVSDPPLPRTDWISRAAAGQPEALERLVREQWPRAERLLRRILGPRHDLEDLMQDVFFETLRALPRFRGDSALSTFVGGIVVRVAMRAMRASHRAPAFAPLSEDLPAQTALPDELAERATQLEAVRNILSTMTPAKRTAFALWAFEGMDVGAIATWMDASVPATRSRIFYAQKELRAAAARHPSLRALIGETT